MEEKVSIPRIVVIGPESTGKSTLCRQLAMHYTSRWVPEFAREYLTGKDAAYTVDDLWSITCGQLESEDRQYREMEEVGYSLPLFVDTDLYVIKIWSEIVFNYCDNRILNLLSARTCDHYLLCDTDLPWSPDPLRENPVEKDRRRIFHHYLDAMINQPVPWTLIRGDEQTRFDSAVSVVNGILGN